MANAFYGTPPRWVIDTASSTAVTTNTIHIRYLLWVSTAASAGDSVVVNDNAGNILWTSVAPGADFVSDEFAFPDKGYPIVGLVVPTLTSGKLYVYLR